jgi:hypothetical protein
MLNVSFLDNFKPPKNTSRSARLFKTFTKADCEFPMANYLFGSSNVYRNFSRAIEKKVLSGHDLQLVNCTKKAVFDSRLATLPSANLVVVSVLENFIVDVCKDVPEEEVRLFAHQQVTAHVESLFGLITRFPDATVIIVPPLFRSVPSWYGSYLPDVLSFLNLEVSRFNSEHLAACSPFLVLPSMLEDDGIHLTAAGGDRFMKHLDTELESLLVEVPENAAPAPVPDRLDQILEAVNRNAAQLDSFQSLGDTVVGLSRSTSDFEEFVKRRFKNDDLIFARMKEESDAELNRSREDRVVITGLPGPASTISTHADKKSHYSAVISDLVKIACAAFDPLPVIKDVYINLRKDRGLPLVEVKFDTIPGANLFRREGAKLAKAKHASFETLFFSNSVTQSTRVRIEILRELSKKLSTSTEVAFVQGFVSRPVLQYRVKDGARSRADGVGRSYTFVDAMTRFGDRLAQKDLGSAYLKAGSTFDGALSQYFVVLADGPRGGRRAVSASNRTPIGRRRDSYGRRGSVSRGRTFLERGLKRTVDFVDIDEDEILEAGPPKRATEAPKQDAMEVTVEFSETTQNNESASVE